MVNQANEDNITLPARLIRSRLFHDHNVNISVATVERCRRSMFTRRREQLVPQLTLQHHLDRLDFCLTHKHNNFHRCAFSDESMIDLLGTGNYVWCEPGAPPPTRIIKSTHVKVMVWAAVWYWGRTDIVIVDGMMSAKKYQQMLGEHLLSVIPCSAGFKFQQDNAPAHGALSTRHFLHQLGVELLDP